MWVYAYAHFKMGKIKLHGNKYKLTILLPPKTAEILKQNAKELRTSQSDIIDNLITEKLRNRKQVLLQQKRQKILEINEIDQKISDLDDEE